MVVRRRRRRGRCGRRGRRNGDRHNRRRFCKIVDGFAKSSTILQNRRRFCKIVDDYGGRHYDDHDDHNDHDDDGGERPRRRNLRLKSTILQNRRHNQRF